MIVTAIEHHVGHGPAPDRKLEVPVPVEWYDMQRTRMSAVAQDGTEFGINVDAPLKDGDVLCELDDKRYVVRIRATEVITVPVDSMERMGKLCYELGNRHLSIRVRPDSVSVPYDHPTFDYVKKLGFEPQVSQDDFSGFLIVKAHAGAGTIVGQHHHLDGEHHGHPHDEHTHGAAHSHDEHTHGAAHSHGGIDDHSHGDLTEHPTA